ncbi:MAG: UDP-glucose dehydrogenase family protein [Promethearchaeota archaeon]
MKDSSENLGKGRKIVSIVGMGYVGLCLAAGLSKFGTKVICVDVDQNKINMINNGQTPIHEPQLPELIESGVKRGIISATNSYKDAIINSDVTFISVGTPCDDEGYIDLKYIKEAAASIGDALKEKESYHVVSVKSTVIPGTTDSYVIPIIEEHSGKKVGVDFGVCMTPEFLKEGNAINDFLFPDKIVIGAYDEKSKDIMYNVFQDFWPERYSKNVFLFCDLRTAEMIKYANNSFLAAKISFINELANLAEIFGVDIAIVSKAMGMDKRISPYFLNSGLGFGGSCFPKDVLALYSAGKQGGYNARMLEATLNINKDQPLRAINKLKQIYSDLEGLTIAILGLAFKPNTDDIRFAPSIVIVNELIKSKANIRVYDPVAAPNFKNDPYITDQSKITYCKSALEAITGADSVILVTEWDQFKELTPDDFLEKMSSKRGQPVLIDGRRLYNIDTFEKSGLRFYAIGLSRKKDFVPKQNK